VQPTSGGIARPKELSTGYLPQEMEHREDSTVIEEARKAFDEVKQMEARIVRITEELGERDDFTSDSYHDLIEELNDLNDRLAFMDASQVEAKIEKVLLGLGFEEKDFDRQMREFSGGWKMRVELAKLLLRNPDLLLLDEPTNHLDIESIEWLEGFLQNYSGAMVLISHDRTFLDRVTQRTIEISKGRIYDFKCSYSKYVVLREEQFQREMEAFKNQQKYIQDTQKLIDKFRAKNSKASFAQSLIKKLDKLDRIDPDDIESGAIHFRFPPAPRSGKVVLEARGVGKNFGQKQLFSKVDFTLARQEKIALVGKNGVGKTTFTRILLAELASEGEVIPGHNVEIGYYAQDQANRLNGEKTVFQTVDEVAEGEIRTKIRALLGAFLFQGDDIEKKVKVLSGGEKARLALCKLLLKPVNLLILDEPTNHLDMRSKDVLKEALANYDGAMIVVSHDRDFLSGLVNIIREVTPAGLKEFRGDIFDFLKEKKADSIAEFERQRKQAVPIKEVIIADVSEDKPAGGLGSKEKKELEKEKKRLKSKVGKLETEIQESEARLAELDREMAAMDYADKDKSSRTLGFYSAEKEKLEKLMEDWAKVEEELAAIVKSEGA
jgi:ATP-binding cassette subfamily F protein 3